MYRLTRKLVDIKNIYETSRVDWKNKEEIIQKIIQYFENRNTELFEKIKNLIVDDEKNNTEIVRKNGYFYQILTENGNIEVKKIKYIKILRYLCLNHHHLIKEINDTSDLIIIYKIEYKGELQNVSIKYNQVFYSKNGLRIGLIEKYRERQTIYRQEIVRLQKSLDDLQHNLTATENTYLHLNCEERNVDNYLDTISFSENSSIDCEKENE